MASYKLPAIAKVNSLPNEELAGILDHLFEPCVPLHTLSVPFLREEAFTSYASLIQGVGQELLQLSKSSSINDIQCLQSILSAHPRLGEKKINSSQSSAEQAQLQGNQAQSEKLASLNAEYERTFPGLRYV